MVHQGVRMGHPYKGTWNARPDIAGLWHIQDELEDRVLTEKWGREWFLKLWPESAGKWLKWRKENDR